MLKKYNIGNGQTIAFEIPNNKPSYVARVTDGKEAVSYEAVERKLTSDIFFGSMMRNLENNPHSTMSADDVISKIIEGCVDAFVLLDTGNELYHEAVIMSDGIIVYDDNNDIFGHVLHDAYFDVTEYRMFRNAAELTNYVISHDNKSEEPCDTTSNIDDEFDTAISECRSQTMKMTSVSTEKVIDHDSEESDFVRPVTRLVYNDNVVVANLTGNVGLVIFPHTGIPYNNRSIYDAASKFIAEYVKVRVECGVAINQHGYNPVKCRVGDKRLKVKVSVFDRSQYIATLVSVCAMNGVKLTLIYADENGKCYQHEIF